MRNLSAAGDVSPECIFWKTLEKKLTMVCWMFSSIEQKRVCTFQVSIHSLKERKEGQEEVFQFQPEWKKSVHHSQLSLKGLQDCSEAVCLLNDLQVVHHKHPICLHLRSVCSMSCPAGMHCGVLGFMGASRRGPERHIGEWEGLGWGTFTRCLPSWP